MEKKWETKLCVKPGEQVYGGTIIAEVQETAAIVHKVMVPPGISGTVETVVPDGSYTIGETLVTVFQPDETVASLSMIQKWPIRVAPSGDEAFSCFPAAGDGTAYPGYPVPHRQGRHGCHSRRIRNGKDHDPAFHRQVVGC